MKVRITAITLSVFIFVMSANDIARASAPSEGEHFTTEQALYAELMVEAKRLQARRAADRALIEKFKTGRPSRVTGKKVLALAELYIQTHDELAPKVDRVRTIQSLELGVAVLKYCAYQAGWIMAAYNHAMIKDSYHHPSAQRPQATESEAEREASERLDRMMETAIWRN